MNTPKLINFSKIGEPALGYISVAEFEKDIPFEIKRVFWTYDTPSQVTRGRHAHRYTEQVLIAVSGIIKLKVEHQGKIYRFDLSLPNQGVYLPTLSWVEMDYSEGAVQMVFASDIYDSEDYIYDKSVFDKL